MYKCTTVLLECCTTCERGGAHGRRARFRPRSTVEMFKGDLAGHIRFRDGCLHHDGSEHDHLKGIRTFVDGVTTTESKRKYLDAVLELLGLEGAKDVPTPCVRARKEQLVTRDLSQLRSPWTGSVLAGYSTTRRTEQTRSLGVDSWVNGW